MNARALALLLAGLAAALLGGWAWPTRTRVEALQREAELARQQVERVARRAAGTPPVPASPDSPASLSESVRRVRRQALALIEGRPLAGVKLEVRAGRPPARCELHLSAEGEFGVLAQLAGELATAPGLVLASVQLTPRGETSHLDLEARGR